MGCQHTLLFAVYRYESILRNMSHGNVMYPVTRSNKVKINVIKCLYAGPYK